MLTVTLPEAEPAELDPELGVIVSQLEPEGNVMAVAVQLNVPLPVFNTVKDCGGVTPPPCTAVNSRPVCERASRLGEGVTLMVTGMVMVCPGLVLETTRVALDVPAERELGLMVATTVAG